jgi:CubicO group peptidase (beta-lactamase class C family)
MPSRHAPGASAEYGIGGYTVLAKVIANAAGMPYPQALKHYVSGPLALHADFEYSSGDPNTRSTEPLPKRAGVYDWEDGRHKNFSFHFGPLAYDAGDLLAASSVSIGRGVASVRRAGASTSTRRQDPRLRPEAGRKKTAAAPAGAVFRQRTRITRR